MKNIYKAEPARVLKITKHTAQEWSFLLDFKTPEEPGKFLMASLPAAGEVPISISGFSSSGAELTIRKTGSVTSEIFGLKPGDTLFVRGPYGTPFPLADFFSQHLLIIAGGSGVAAVKSVVDYFIRGDEGTCRLKELDLLLGFRSPGHLLFKDSLKKWKKWGEKCRLILSVDKIGDEKRQWEGEVGFVTKFIGRAPNLGAQTRAIVVGPPLMMMNAVKELLRHGVDEGKIWLSFERHMKCGVGKCGHCRIRDKYVCVDGPVFNYSEAKELID